MRNIRGGFSSLPLISASSVLFPPLFSIHTPLLHRPAGSHRGHRGKHARYSLGDVYVADTAGEVLLQVLNDCVIFTSTYIAIAGACG